MKAEIDVLARTIFGEARGEGYEGMEAVACVIINRVKSGVRWWGDTIITVCLKPWQFSCWNANDPNKKIALEVTKTNPVFSMALDIAEKAVAGDWEDVTNGADHYHAKKMKEPPQWAVGKKPVAKIGNHLFFHLGSWKDLNKGDGHEKLA